MQKGETDGQQTPYLNNMGVPDPNLIPEEKTSKELDEKMKKKFEEARGAEKTEYDQSGRISHDKI